jgi:hypothetical protein
MNTTITNTTNYTSNGDSNTQHESNIGGDIDRSYQ